MTQTEVRAQVSSARQQEAPEASGKLSLEAFQDMLREAGIAPIPLEITRRRFFSDTRAGRRAIYRVAWPHQRKISLFGLWVKEWTGAKSGSFIKCGLNEITMPVEAELISARVKDRPEVEEAAVFVETRIDPILAVRVEGQWLELFRWFTVPTFLRDFRELTPR